MPEWPPGPAGAWAHQPPRPQRRPVAWLVLPSLVLVLLLGGTAWVARPVGHAPSFAGSQYLPDDGAVRVEQWDGRRTVVESAILTGGQLVASGPGWLALLGPVQEVVESSYLRETATISTPEGTTSALTVDQISTEGVLRVAAHDDVTGRPWLLRPGPVLLPANARDGASWEGAGEVNVGRSTHAYTYTASASSADNGCLRVQVQFVSDAGNREWERLWCQRSGSADLRPLPDPVAPLHTVEWDVEAWAPHRVDLRADPPVAWLTRLRTASASNLLIMVHDGADDLLFVPPDDMARTWRAHPGGSITSLVRFGGLAVVTTTKGKVLGYGTDGERHWELRMPEIVNLAPVLLDGMIVAVDEAGNIAAVDARSGERRWEASLGDPPTAPPVVCGETVAVGGRSGQINVLGTDGKTAWEAEAADAPDYLACTPDGVVSTTGNELQLFADGDNTIYTRLHDSPPRGMVPFQGGVATISRRGLTVYGPDLTRRWGREGEFLDIVTDGSALAVRTETELVALTAEGEQLGQWDLSGLVAGRGPLSPIAGGVQVVSSKEVITWRR